MIYEDRHDAGRSLAASLSQYAGRSDVQVLALPRGGVPVGYEVACALRVPLDVFVVRKLGVPEQEELAMGAVASGGIRIVNDSIVRELGMPGDVIDAITRRELQEIERREKLYRGQAAPADINGKIVILVDDGLATGATMRAAVRAVRTRHPSRIIVAVPVAAASSCEDLSEEADEVMCTHTPASFFAVGQWYRHFEQTSDEEVRKLLRRAREHAQPHEVA